MGEMSIEYYTGPLPARGWWVKVGIDAAIHLGDLSPEAGDYEVRRVAEETLAKMAESATVWRSGQVDHEVQVDAALRVASIHAVSVTTSEGTRRTDVDPVTVNRGDRISVHIGEDGAPSVSVEKRLTDKHMAALREWAKRYGATWRLKLRHAWECGTLTNHASAVDAELLQQVRNIIGPSRLAAVKL